METKCSFTVDNQWNIQYSGGIANLDFFCMHLKGSLHCYLSREMHNPSAAATGTAEMWHYLCPHSPQPLGEARWAAEHLGPLCLSTDFEGLPQNGPSRFSSHNRQLPKQGGPEREEHNSQCSHSNVTYLIETLITVRPACLRYPDMPKNKNTFIYLRARWVLHFHFIYR